MIIPRLIPTFLTTGALAISSALVSQAQTFRYWNPTGSEVQQGGSGVWTSANDPLHNETPVPSSTLVSSNSSNHIVFHGAPGSVEFSFEYNRAAAIFQTDGYTFWSNSSNRNVNTQIVIGDNVNLNMLANNSTNGSSRRINLTGGISGGDGSTLTLQGAPTSSQWQYLIMLSPNQEIAVPIVISNTRDYGSSGTRGVIGIQASNTGLVLSGGITNNSDQGGNQDGNQTALGATNGNDLTVTGVISGNQGIRIQSQQSENNPAGAGIVTLSAVNTYEGPTVINNAAAGVLRMGAENAISNASEIRFGVSGKSGSVGAIDLNGFNQTVTGITTADLGSDTANGITNTNAGTAVLTINGNLTRSYGSIIGIPDNVTNLAGANNNIALVMDGTGTQTLTGANTYAGGTTILGGTLATASTGLLGTGNVSVLGGTLHLGHDEAIGETADLLFHSLASIILDYGGTQTIGSLFQTDTATGIDTGIYDASQLNTFFGSSVFSGGGFIEVTTVIPEPSVYALLLSAGVLGLVILRRRRS